MSRPHRRLAAAVSIVPLAFAAGGIATRLALGAAPPVAAPGFEQPLAVVTGWGSFGAALWALLGFTVLAAAVGAIATTRRLREPGVDPGVAIALVFAGCALALVAALSWPVLFSSDVYAYAAYGDEALRGVDPYAPLPAGVRDPWLAAAAWQWGGAFPVCVYGDVFVAGARGLVAATHGLGVAWTLAAFRAAAAASFLAACAGLLLALPRHRRRGAAGNAAGVLAAVALNPVAIWTAAEGHNDAVMLATALAGACVVRWFGPLIGGIGIGLSSAVKAPGALVGLAVSGFSLIWAPRRLRGLALAVGAGALIAAAPMLPRALAVAAHFGGISRYEPQFSLQGLAVAACRELGAGSSAPTIGIAAALLACAAMALRGAAAIGSGDSTGFGWMAIAAWLAIPNPYPWYALWILPVAALVPTAAAFAALWTASISIVVRYLPDAYGALQPDAAVVIAAIALAPLLLTVRGGRRVQEAPGAALP